MDKRLKEILGEERAFAREGYEFLLEALEKVVEKKGDHVSGQELLQSVKELALERFGFLTRTVFDQWGIKRTEDFGKMVFELVDKGVMGKQESDTMEDFANGFDFAKVFEKEYQIKLPEEFNPRNSKEIRE